MPHPQAYISADGDSITAPVYRLIGDAYFDDTTWFEGDIIVTDNVPNDAMQPLNQAAAERVAAWQDSMPVEGKGLTLADIVEAANMLRSHKMEDGNDASGLSPEQFNAAMIGLAVRLREKRRGGMVIPTPTRSARLADTPVMPNANFLDPRAVNPNLPMRGPQAQQPKRETVRGLMQSAAKLPQAPRPG